MMALTANERLFLAESGHSDSSGRVTASGRSAGTSVTGLACYFGWACRICS